MILARNKSFTPTVKAVLFGSVCSEHRARFHDLEISGQFGLNRAKGGQDVNTMISIILGVLAYAGLSQNQPELDKLILLSIILGVIRLAIKSDRNVRQRKNEEKFRASMIKNYHEILDYHEKMKKNNPTTVKSGGLTITYSNSRQDLVVFGHRHSKKCIVLFLRPFYLDKRFRVINHAGSWRRCLPFYNMAAPSTTTLDDAISLAINGYGELIAIGDRVGDIGATRVQTTKTEWKDAFYALADAASTIIVYTSNTPGTVWETGEILSNARWIRKSIFILPPINSMEDFRGEHLHAVRDHMRDMGCALPEDVGHGDAIVLSPKKLITKRVKLIKPSVVELELNSKKLKKMVFEIGV